MTTIEKFVTQAQEGVLQAGRQLTKAQGRAISALEEARANATAGLPSAAQLVETNYAFAGQLLQIQKELTLHWVDALAPTTEAAKPAKASS
jgi:hypothetical protein